MRIVYFLISAVLFFSCGNKQEKSDYSTNGNKGESVELFYARGFKIDLFDGYKSIIVYNPWKKGAVLDRYYLTEDEDLKLPDDGKRIIVPVNSVVSASSTHYSFLEYLGEIESLSGICDVKRTYNSKIINLTKSGKIEDLGDPFKINIEKCLMLKPDIVMFSAYNQFDENVSRLNAAGIKVIYNNEWMEESLLGRAEWIKFIACFFAKESQADSIFNLVKLNYINISQQVKGVQSAKPSVISGDNFRGTWYQPGGRSYTAGLFNDAGAEYKYKNDTTSGSIPFSFEQVFHDLKDADIWVGATNGKTLEELKASDERYSLFKPFREKQVYSYNARTTKDGGNDFWESAVVRPDILLQDFIKIFHPDLLPDHKFVYIKKLD